MKRYLVFYFSKYYPSGGIEDFIEDFNTLEEAVNKVYELANNDKAELATFDDFFEYNKAHVYDTEERKIVWCK